MKLFKIDTFRYFLLFITLAISKCYGKVRVLFFRATTLVSARKSHSSGVRGLVVRCLLFNPEGSCSNPEYALIFLQVFRSRTFSLFRHYETPPFFGFVRLFFRNFLNVLKGSSLQFVLIFCNRTNVKKSQRVPSFRFFGTMRLLKILILFVFFSKIFQRLLRFPFNFLKFCNRMVVKKFQRAPFTVFGIARNFKMNNFCLKISFSEAQHAISEFCFFLETGVFFSNFLKFVFIEAPQFLFKMKRFASIKDCSRFSALCDLPETFSKKNFEKFRIFFLIFMFFKKMFPVEKDGFFAVSS